MAVLCGDGESRLALRIREGDHQTTADAQRGGERGEGDVEVGEVWIVLTEIAPSIPGWKGSRSTGASWTCSRPARTAPGWRSLARRTDIGDGSTPCTRPVGPTVRIRARFDTRDRRLTAPILGSRSGVCLSR